MEIKIISQQEIVWYTQMVDLRYKILREPLGLNFNKQQLENESNDIHIIGIKNNKVVACCLLTKKNESTLQLRQMAVDNDMQGKQLGKQIIEFAEKWAKENNYNELMMHARKNAVDFYVKNNYIISGKEFIEVTIPHVYMSKKLQ